MSDTTDTGLDDTQRPSNSGASAAKTLTDELTLPETSRYADLRILGAGGMGEVRLVKDLRLEREVALKRMHGALDHSDDTRRFLREVKVQGQLDHPSVVPVYDLGLTPDGAPWFTMKRVRGQTLLSVLHALREKDVATTARYTRWRLLSVFTTVCECIHSAHARGVLHRDLKPGNVMLGEFGEVHVLDWGLARVNGQRAADDHASQRIVPAVDEHGTQLGMTMGTPGYMSPEQAQGRIDELDERTDVYSLGAILFELLYLAPLHDAPTLDAKLKSTQAPLRDSPQGSVPPELDALWRKACASDPKQRFESARALSEAVERFLEGERDEERRRALAAEQLALAEQAAVDSHAGRSAALKALGRALALQPTNAAALRRLSALLENLPTETPPEAQKQLAQQALARAQQTAFSSALRLGSWALGLVAAALLFGVKSVPLLACVLTALVAAAGVTWLLGRRPGTDTQQRRVGLIGVVCVAMLSLALHPLVVVPTLAATHAMLMAASISKEVRRLVVISSIVAASLPLLLLRVHDYVTVREGALVLTSPLISFDSAVVPPFLLAFSLLPLITPAVLLGRVRDAMGEAERRVVIQAAALRQLVPEE
jgi:tRNA A-37 threonylcarbamoyl transferase component Bud32